MGNFQKQRFSLGQVVIMLALVFIGIAVISYAAVTIPYTFTSGTTISSSEVNANFQALKEGMPGIQFLNIGSVSNISTTITNCGSIVITAPIDGYVLVQVSGYAVTFGQNTVVDVGIGGSTTAFDYYTVAGVLDGSDTLRREFSLNVTGVYSVAAGAKTIYLLAQKPSVFSAQQVNLGNLFISAIFIPNRY
jgi:hypothetical protein